MKVNGPRIVLLVALGLYLAYWTLSWRRVSRLVDASVHQGALTALEQATKTGDIVFIENDSYVWLSMARAMLVAPTWRVRWTLMDNPPDGRPVHWSQPFAWLLVGAAGLAGAILPGGALAHLPAAATVVNPLLFWLLAAGCAWLISKRLGFLYGLLAGGLLLAASEMTFKFHPLAPDHHGLQILCAVGAALGLMLGGAGYYQPNLLSKIRLDGRDGARPSRNHCKTRASEMEGRPPCRPLDVLGAAHPAGTDQGPGLPASRAVVRQGFLLSAVAGGCGLWTGATVYWATLALLSLWGFITVYRLPERRRLEAAGLDYDARAWRWWGWTGAGVSLLAYALEYAPNYLALRLEINHPVHALGWLALGEFLYRLAEWRLTRRPLSFGRGARLLLAGLLAALPLALILGGPVAWYSIRDPLILRMHRDIAEFQPGHSFVIGRFVLESLRSFGVLPVLWAGSIWWLRRRGRTMPTPSILGGILLCGGFLAATLLQLRWMAFYAAFSALHGVFFLQTLVESNWGARQNLRTALKWTLAAALSAQILYGLQREQERIDVMRHGKWVHPNLVRAILMKNVAREIGRQSGAESLRFVGDPDMAPILYYYAGIPSATSYYWENAAGLQAAMEFFTRAPTDPAARGIARAHGWTHALVSQGPTLAEWYFYLATGRRNAFDAGRSLGGLMGAQKPGLPEWIVYDVALSAIGQADYLLATPGGSPSPLETRYLLYRLDTDNPQGQARESSGAEISVQGSPR